MRDRLAGYEKAITDFGLKPNVLHIPCNEMFQVKKYLKKNLNGNLNLDAVFFATNNLTQTALEVSKENNYNLVSHLGIMSFDDNDMFKIYPISISCISQPLFEISTKLMELMLVLLNKEYVAESTQNIILKAELIIRESTLRRNKI